MTVSSWSLRTPHAPVSARSSASRKRIRDVPHAGGAAMKFRAVRPAAIGKVDAVIVPLPSDGAVPAGLPRAVRTIVERIAKAEAGAGRLYGVTTHHAEPRVVVVGTGKAGELDTERAHNVAAAGIKSLWRRHGTVMQPLRLTGGLADDHARPT